MSNVAAFTLDIQRLPMWVIYDHPSDHPEGYVARLHYSLPTSEPTPVAILWPELEPLRDFLEGCGCVKLDRRPEDDPVIMEVWVA